MEVDEANQWYSIIHLSMINMKDETLNKNDRTCRDVKTHNVWKQGQDGTAMLS